ncbi:rod shape-determining protein MreC [Thiomonas bhubaneswarensis]|uniref:Cell shape-determining protein MreC n=1 Tax=Thiomonas bhubaneswarensis TaxID=339866 RepID=A0A0K6HST4_9BURK|nr:rod shape-determining protein MreC [Thiomonas bhubaneswarensis]CUA93838.1 rod shape-determining protein MreC [Thiomonas bhubaneswarensis]
MAYGTLERSPPPFFRQGPSALTRLLLFAALAVLLMALDVRFKVTPMLRQGLSVVIYPLQRIAQTPVNGVRQLSDYLEAPAKAQAEIGRLQRANVALSLQAQLEAQLRLENNRLRALLRLQQSQPPQSVAAQISAQASDPFSRAVQINRGSLQGVELGSPVIDETGLLGQVTRDYPWSAEVTLITDRDAVVPVQNQRTGERGVLYGEPGMGQGGMELRWMPAAADVRVGDLLVTSGVDGIYPAGLRVARVTSVTRQRDTAFARVMCAPIADVEGGRHVLVLKPLTPLVAAPATDKGKSQAKPAAAASAMPAASASREVGGK